MRILARRAKGESAFPGVGRRGADLPALDDARRIGELERKIGESGYDAEAIRQGLRG